MKITIDIPVTIDVNTNLPVLIRDALHDFCVRRTPHIHYVTDRYAGNSTEFLKTKRREVENRVNIARKLQGSKIEVI